MLFSKEAWFIGVSFQLLFFLTVAYAENKIVSCGAPGGYCNVKCFDRWTYSYPQIFAHVCILVDIIYTGVNNSETDLDLSHLSLDLSTIPLDCLEDSFPKERINSLNLAHNLFYNKQTLDALKNFVGEFPNLRVLNLSNITTGQPEARSIEDTWTKNFNLSVLDISNNRNWWKISNSSFKAMVNMKDLRLSECCSAEQNFVSDFLRDLVNIERLDISFNSWNLSFYDSLFFSLEHLIYLNISGKESSRNRGWPHVSQVCCDSDNFQHYERHYVQRYSAILPDISVALKKQKKLETLDLSFLNQELDVSSLAIDSTHFAHLALQGTLMTGFSSMETSFGLKDPSSLRTLDLSATKLAGSLGVFPRDLTGLQIVNLSRSTNILESFDTNFFSNNSLVESLDLSYLQISGSSTHFFKGLKFLKSLALEGTTLTSPAENRSGMLISMYENILTNLKSLENLLLKEAKCQNCNLWKQLGTCAKIKHLDLTSSEGFKIDSEVYFKFPNIETVNLSYAAMNAFRLTNFAELKQIHLSQTKVDDFAIIGQTKLESLDFSLSDMGSVMICGQIDQEGSSNQSISGSPQLETLNFSDSTMALLNLTNLNYLRSTDLSHSKIDRLVISKMDNLRKIDLSYANVRVMTISKTPKLEMIDFANLYQSLDVKRLNLNRFKKLANLNFSACNLFSLPDKVFNELQCLRSLNLSSNFLSELPKNMLAEQDTCPLTELDLSNNYLKVLPADEFKSMVVHSDWTIYLGRNLLNCSDCRNSWMANKNYQFNLQDATCQTPFKYHGKHVTDISIC